MRSFIHTREIHSLSFANYIISVEIYSFPQLKTISNRFSIVFQIALVLDSKHELFGIKKLKLSIPALQTSEHMIYGSHWVAGG
ncbi:hypothetical protein CH354_01325 [Leptospira levettii]|nr:hypothetical protein CH354_01325 [Leptospira levettii]PJZ87532.1 hypothetical protein CH368_16405 [Leptospira levettii]PKA01320.1 hypothetical protein CH369_05995 [Leptospira levettii]